MDRTTLEAGRARVAERAASLERELGSLAEQQSLTSHDDEHDPEGVTIAVQRAQLQGLLEAARVEIAELDRAVTRLDDGTYGFCATCGDPIAPERLEALPAATTCIRCAERRRRPRF
ncbi:TraR/DksA family transcriptional regulator [Pseudonocardia endophytica]|uniref:TraR/DksA family transcriptional regulator n=1 Tax=Pseudonocardia endophytica TaxID=401976 RepID=A0A4R1HM42_PSEEN|nr:TraR/DksA family transcriptional regulator [Pseudonocardia endophytica]TCK21605.1 TraR/DksA family transcriptional regulator [Pseudonocardia endophytica]